MAKTFQIEVSTINGEILESPLRMDFHCDSSYPVGESIVRAYDANFCIVAKKVFLFKYSGNVFGTTEVSNTSAFTEFRNSRCTPCDDGACRVYLNGCVVTLNDCYMEIQR